MKERFRTRWFVDIEILLRYRALNKIDLILWEEPVTLWRDVTGSRISFRNWISIALEIVILFFRYRGDRSSKKVH